MNPKITLMLVDDHAVVRAGYRLLLFQTGTIEVEGQAQRQVNSTHDKFRNKPMLWCRVWIYCNTLIFQRSSSHIRGIPTMQWETPSYTDLRFGFEVTMYIYNR